MPLLSILLAAAAVLGLLALNGWCLLQIAAQNGRLALRADALAARLAAPPLRAGGTPGAAPARSLGGNPRGPLPEVSLTDLDGRSVALADLGADGRPVALVVTDPRCGPCAEILPDVGRWQREHAGRLTVALVSAGTAEANRAHVAGHGIERVLLQRDLEFVEAFGLSQAPAAVIVQPDGSLDGAAVYGAPAIRAAIAQAAGVPDPLPATPRAGAAGPVAPLAAGDRVPPLRLPDLDGGLVDLAGLEGAPAVLLFWNPGCGHCQGLVSDIKAREAAAAVESPRLVVISRGTAEVNRAAGLPAPVLLDEGMAASRAFGVQGTPAAVLVDAGGRVVAEPARGGRAVRALLAAV